ncbi:MAG: LacI family DNA-binding transcriptional regulator [Bacillota bacterium]|nr:LacI family DNA-binding transcriptional regulator [Bacillota bacterium]
MANIKDVAEKSGVTVTTVSRVLNNRGYISDKTREKVYKAMEELNYQPNEIARALLKRKSNLIGLIIPNVSHPFFAELSNYVEYYAYKNGYKILLCNAYQDSKKEKDYIDMLKRNQVDGIIMGSHTLETSVYLNLKLPIVAIDRFLSRDIPYITSDNYKGGAAATKLLIDKGCKNLAHISGPLRLSTPANKRCESFIDVAKSNNIPYTVVETKLNNFNKQEYEELIYTLFKEHPDIDGIFASSDYIAACIVEVSSNLGKKIPENLKIVGFDDTFIASLITPSLTTIKQSIEKLGQLAVEIIINQIDGKEVDEESILPVELIERKTT